MRKLRRLIKPSTAILAGCVVAVLLLLPTQSFSVNWGSGHGAWVRTQAADDASALCASEGGSEWCREWCNEFDGTLEPTGEFCCAGPDGICNATDLIF